MTSAGSRPGRRPACGPAAPAVPRAAARRRRQGRVGAGLGQQGPQPLGHGARGPGRALLGHARQRVVDEHDVGVAGEPHLPAAQPAHRDHGHPGRQRRAAGLLRLGHGRLQRGRHGHAGDDGQRLAPVLRAATGRGSRPWRCAGSRGGGWPARHARPPPRRRGGRRRTGPRPAGPRPGAGPARRCRPAWRRPRARAAAGRSHSGWRPAPGPSAEPRGCCPAAAAGTTANLRAPR